MTKILIIGAGSGGISAAARLRHRNKNYEITLVDPSKFHYYQPLWTLVGGGAAKKEATCRPMKKVIPEGVSWVPEAVQAFQPDTNHVTLVNGTRLSYDYLIVCPGIQINWNKIEGLPEALGKGGVCSNYSYDSVDSTWEAIRNTKKGNALFTYPNTPIKCGGAPQKIMYLAENYFRNKGVRNSINVEFVSAGENMFAVKKYRDALDKVVANLENRGSHPQASTRCSQ